MSKRKAEVRKLLEELKIAIDDRDDELILITMNTETYENREGENIMKILITPGKSSHVVETIMVIVPFCYILAPNMNTSALHEFFLVQNFSYPLVKFSYDAQDGEIQARVDLAVGNKPMEKEQLAYALAALHNTMENIHDTVVALIAQKPSFKDSEQRKAENIVDRALSSSKESIENSDEDDDFWI